MKSNIVYSEHEIKDDERKQKVVFVDSTIPFEKIEEITKFKDTKIIAFDYKSRKKLLEKKFEHLISDDFLSEKDLELIQSKTYKLSKWFEENEIQSEIIFENINVGKLFHEQFAEFLVGFLKKFREINNIFINYPNAVFFASGILYSIIKLFSNSTVKISENIQETDFVFDKVRVDLKIGNHYFMMLISRNFYLKLKKMSEILINLFFGPKKNRNTKSSLLIEIHTKRYNEILSKSKDRTTNLFFYGRRRPAIWDFESYKMFRKSNCKIIVPQILKNKEFEKMVNYKTKKLKIQMEKLWKNEKFFSRFFSEKGFSSSDIIKSTLTQLISKRLEEVVTESELVSNLFKKFHFDSITIFQEIGFTEQIVISHAKEYDIPIILLQQGLYYDTKESKTANDIMTVYPKNADIFAVWGDNTKFDTIENTNFPTEKIHVIGAPRYDKISKKGISDRGEYVLIAAQGPAYNYVQGHQINNFERYENTISKICKIVLKQNKKLIIKLHPSPKEFDITELVKKINSEIQVVTTGDIIPLIKSCDLMISLGASTSIIEAQILHKPVIIIPVVDYKMGKPKIFSKEFSKICNLDNFESELKNILNDKKMREKIIQKGDNFAKQYVANINNASKKFLELIESI